MAKILMKEIHEIQIPFERIFHHNVQYSKICLRLDFSLVPYLNVSDVIYKAQEDKYSVLAMQKQVREWYKDNEKFLKMDSQAGIDRYINKLYRRMVYCVQFLTEFQVILRSF